MRSDFNSELLGNVNVAVTSVRAVESIYAFFVYAEPPFQTRHSIPLRGHVIPPSLVRTISSDEDSKFTTTSVEVGLEVGVEVGVEVGLEVGLEVGGGVEVDEGVVVVAAAVVVDEPGAGKPREVSSMTSTESPSGDWNVRLLEVGYVPTLVATPVAGEYHHTVALLPEIFDMLMVTARRDGTYTMIVSPSDVRAAVARLVPDDIPLVTIADPKSGTRRCHGRDRNRRLKYTTLTEPTLLRFDTQSVVPHQLDDDPKCQLGQLPNICPMPPESMVQYVWARRCCAVTLCSRS